jgi:energy-coupling factor transport system substrate-specific component
VSWSLASFAVLALVILTGCAWYERTRPPARVVAMVAALAALAVVGRLAFAALPNVKPTTDIVLFAGYALGGVPGFMVGAVTALASNVFFGQGPWTAWQMVGWGGVGVAGALLARLWRGREPSRIGLAAACGAAGLGFGAFMDVYQWSFTYANDPGSYFVVASTSLPYNLAHALGNVVFCLLIGPVFIRALRRYRRRFEIRWEAPRAAQGVAAALALTAVLAAAPALVAAPAAEAASSSSKAARYLLRAQNRDGGFGAARGQASNGLMTGWAALGLAAARQHPRHVHRRRGRSITTFLRRTSRRLTDLGELERTILVLKAAGSSPRRFGRRNLVAELLGERRGNGSFRGQASYTAFGMVALKAAGRSAGAASADWLARAQNGDGGWGLSPVAGSDVDLTGACLQALAAAGRRGGATARDGVRYLREAQNGDGGFGTRRGRSSNSQSTAYAVQGLLAVGGSGDRVGRALAYLKRRQRRDGSIAYSSSSAQTPVWVTAQALLALRRKPFPLATVPTPRRRSRGGSASRSSAPGPGADSAAGRARAARGRPTARGSQGGTAAARAASDLGALNLRSAGAATRVSSEGGPPGGLWVGGLALALLVALLTRRQLRRRRPAAG